MGVEETHEQPSVQARFQLVRSIARALNSANNAITLYPPESPMQAEAAAGFLAVLDRFLMFEPYLQLAVFGDQLCLEDEDVCGTSGSVRRFAFQLHARQVGQIRFLPGLEAEECVRFLRILSAEPEALRAKGGLAKALVGNGIEHVKVVDLAQEAAADSAGAGFSAPDATRVGGVAGLSTEALVASDPTQVCVWLRETAETVSASSLDERARTRELAGAVSAEAAKAVSLGGAQAQLGLDNLTEAIVSMDDSSRRSLIGALMKPEDNASALAAILARLDDDELVAALAGEAIRSGTNPAELMPDGGLNPSRRDRILGKANALMRIEGPAEPDSTAAAAPTPAAAPPPASLQRTTVHDPLPRFSRQGDDVPFSAAQLVTGVREFTQQERDSLLQAPHEAKANDVSRPMTTLLYLLNRTNDADRAVETLASIVTMANYALDLGNIEAITRGVVGMRVALERSEPTSAFGHGLEAAIDTLSSHDVATKVVRLLDGTDAQSRLADATAYFAAAKPAAQEAAIDVLGTDVSGELRQNAQAILKDLGPRAIGVMERHVTDQRWGVAHSAVVILGGMAEPRVVPALRRALTHPEPRVVEQAMRGLAAIASPEAKEALASAIDEGSGAMRMLAIELAGRMRSARAAGPLGRVVTEGDLFGRAIQMKCAATDALAAIGTPGAAQALQAAAHVRFLFSPGKTRVLRDRARLALGQLTSRAQNPLAPTGGEGGGGE